MCLLVAAESAKADNFSEWESYVDEQLAATGEFPLLDKHRHVVSARLESLRSLACSSLDKDLPMQLPEADDQIRKNAFTDGKLDDGAFKAYNKKFAAYVTLLSNATTRLVECHSEECAIQYEEAAAAAEGPDSEAIGDEDGEGRDDGSNEAAEAPVENDKDKDSKQDSSSSKADGRNGNGGDTQVSTQAEAMQSTATENGIQIHETLGVPTFMEHLYDLPLLMEIGKSHIRETIGGKICIDPPTNPGEGASAYLLEKVSLPELDFRKDEAWYLSFLCMVHITT